MSWRDPREFKVGQEVFIVYIGTEVGTGISIKEAILMRRNNASWTVEYKNVQYGRDRTHFDKSKDTSIFGTHTEAKAFIVDILKGRVVAAEDVLRRRQIQLTEWESI